MFLLCLISIYSKWKPDNISVFSYTDEVSMETEKKYHDKFPRAEIKREGGFLDYIQQEIGNE